MNLKLATVLKSLFALVTGVALPAFASLGSVAAAQRNWPIVYGSIACFMITLVVIALGLIVISKTTTRQRFA